jgi:hypothetical protein
VVITTWTHIASQLTAVSASRISGSCNVWRKGGFYLSEVFTEPAQSCAKGARVTQRNQPPATQKRMRGLAPRAETGHKPQVYHKSKMPAITCCVRLQALTGNERVKISYHHTRSWMSATERRNW